MIAFLETCEGIAETMALGKTRRSILGTLAATIGLLLALPVASAADGPPLEGTFGERFKLKDNPQPAPDATFKSRSGETLTLADFEGRVVLVNFWATWCAPCVEEMPTLDALQADLGSDRFTVAAISEDKGGFETVEPFLRDKLNLESLDIYLDTEGKLARAFGLRGMPTTYLVDARGRVVGRLEGVAEWDTEAVKDLIRYYIERANRSETTRTER